MGKTTPTTSILLQRERRTLNRYRKTLTMPYRNAFDDLWVYASHYQMPCNCADFPLPFYFYMLSMLIHQQKTLARLEALNMEQA